MKKQSVYLKILKQKTEPILHEEQDWFVILAKEPINTGHILVIPKIPSEKFYETPNIGRGFEIATEFAKILQKIYKPPRVSLFVKGFTVEQHSHIHVLPIYDRRDMAKNKEELEQITKKEMESVANSINKVLQKNPIKKASYFR